MTETQKRFIAGAVCPACRETDKTVVYKREATNIRECIACGHSEDLADLGRQQELATRVNQPTKAIEVEPVSVIDIKNKDKH